MRTHPNTILSPREGFSLFTFVLFTPLLVMQLLGLSQPGIPRKENEVNNVVVDAAVHAVARVGVKGVTYGGDDISRPS